MPEDGPPLPLTGGPWSLPEQTARQTRAPRKRRDRWRFRLGTREADRGGKLLDTPGDRERGRMALPEAESVEGAGA